MKLPVICHQKKDMNRFIYLNSEVFNNNNNNFISIALLSYVQGALQSCKQHYWKIFTNLLPYPNIFTMDKKGKIETKTTIKPYS